MFNNHLPINCLRASSILPLESCILCLASSTFVENPLQISLFLQNKPNLLNALMNANYVKTMNYEQRTMDNANKNKPNQTQFMVSKVEPPVVSLPALSMPIPPALSAAEGSTVEGFEMSNLFQNQKHPVFIVTFWIRKYTISRQIIFVTNCREKVNSWMVVI